MSKQSFTAADNNIPVKIIQDHCMMLSITEDKHIPLRHLQLCPTNVCNLSCDFCSCKDRQKTEQLSYEQVEKILYDARDAGCKAVTITGGGEPLMHPQINEIIDLAQKLDIGVGLVTNGMMLDKLTTNVKWCRISFDSSRDIGPLVPIVRSASERLPDIDWAFSFVLYDKVGQVEDLVKLANGLDFTHVRVVADIFNPDEGLMFETQVVLNGIDDKVIYQPRSNPTRGTRKCLVSLLRPTISAEGNIFPCCGAQYAITGSDRDFVDEMSMGNVDKLKEIWGQQLHFDGSKCDVCYYNGYNNVLDLLEADVTHKEWV